jgi:antitoxin (DNA-binding transcriptional repressor) of toxin-antitoxin stability system
MMGERSTDLLFAKMETTMSATLTVKEAQAKLPELIGKLVSGEEIVITENEKPVAKLVGGRTQQGQRPAPGNCRGMLTINAEDDEHLKDFEEYMP